ncbi:hypothetical protein K435DRAFT_838994 [Dendrothele bispora CBS 962.96]|uniref:T6SS Phospholipase effector Tle1-like catalytic domain-containing protein n=1 Tax=Dendrothele bispora (strain CBS 962.96) TaxID=1314807 RepID=A0A4S8M3I6_DENBC|nr:hypothetical protein K435DRAFT_838994 [Dendrothele bispora CBS 962.96]
MIMMEYFNLINRNVQQNLIVLVLTICLLPLYSPLRGAKSTRPRAPSDWSLRRDWQWRPTNVAHFSESLHNNSQSASGQVVKYFTGIGTYRPSGADRMIPYYGKITQKVDQGLAIYFPYHVIDAYKELCEIYEPGDSISLLACTTKASLEVLTQLTRSVAAVVSFFGILPKENLTTDVSYHTARYFTDVVDFFGLSNETRSTSALEKIFDTYFNLQPFDLSRQSAEEYKTAELEFVNTARKFREDYYGLENSTPVKINFLGVWDCVKSVGLLRARGALFTSFNPYVKVFRHAVSLDERRSKFDRTMWVRKDESEVAHLKLGPNDVTDVKQVWFAGSHSDIGGGSEKVDAGSVDVDSGTGKSPADFITVSTNYRSSSLANIPLRWMVLECFRTNSGITFNTSQLERMGLLSPLLKSPGSVVQASQSNLSYLKTDEDIKKEDDLDALAEIHDQLSISWRWSALEWMPVQKLDPDTGNVTLTRGKAGRLEPLTRCQKVGRSRFIKVSKPVWSGKKFRIKEDISVKSPEVEWVQ